MAFASPVRVWLVGEQGSSLQTVAQVVPATVVAIFVFALGAVFFIAQIVIPSRGSRAISVLLRFRRIRLVLAGGLALLVGSLLITANAPPWRAALAAALILATGVYVPAATGLIASALVAQTSPRTFTEQLLAPPRRPGIVRRPRNGQAESWRAEDLYQSLRVFRGWIRTVNRIGESRDLQFALDGLHRLVQDYATQVRRELDATQVRRELDATQMRRELDAKQTSALQKGPPDFESARRSKVSRIPEDFCGHLAQDGMTPATGTSQASVDLPPRAAADSPWFSSEVGRALARAVESGVRGNTLRRDLERLLNTFDLSIQVLVPCEEAKGRMLDAEAGTLLIHLVEIGLGVRQSDETHRGWYVAPALRLARLEGYLEHVTSQRGGSPASGTLATMALGGWLVASEAFLAAGVAGDRQLRADVA
jgi:hypothetical protein